MREMNIADSEVMTVIRKKYDSIFPAEKKIADFIMQNPIDAVSLTVSELANVSGVSDATVVRMCHHLGYSGYYQFRLLLSRDLGKQQPQGENTILPNDGIGQVFQGFSNDIIAIGNKMKLEDIRNSIQLLQNATYVHILGVGNTSNLARYMGFRMERLGIKCTNSTQPEYFINHINLANESDVVLAITKSGSSKRVLDGIMLAIEKKLKIIVISAYDNSPAAKLADYVINSNGSSIQDTTYKGYSYLNEFVVIESLLKFLVNQNLINEKHADRPELLLAEDKI